MAGFGIGNAPLESAKNQSITAEFKILGTKQR
jgi:hypothetical protein